MSKTNYQIWLENPTRPYFDKKMVGNTKKPGRAMIYAILFVAVIYGVLAFGFKATGFKIYNPPPPVVAASVPVPKASGEVYHLNSGVPPLPFWVEVVQDTPLMSGRSIAIAVCVLGLCLCLVAWLALGKPVPVKSGKGPRRKPGKAPRSLPM